MRLLPPSGPSRVVAVTTVAALAAGAAGWSAAAGVKSPADAAAGRRPPVPSLITVPVERRPLRARVTVQASVAYRKATPIVLNGTVAPVDGGLAAGQVVTRAATAGRTLAEGDVLLEINGRPVFVLRGKVPMYRTLVEGSTGDDVDQLRAALRRLLPGTGLAATGPLTGGVLDCVARWYRKRGYSAAGPTAEQRQELRRLERAVRSAKPADRAAAESALAGFRRANGARIHGGEIVFLPRLPVRLTAATAKAGTVVAGEVATVADPGLVVDGKVAPEDAKLLDSGQAATLTAASGQTYRARVDSVGAAVTAGKKDDGAAPAAASVRLAAVAGVSLAGLAGQSVRAEITVGDTGDAVLVVPVAAVFTRADGQAHVTVDAGPAGTRDVPVTTGLTADGYAEVTPAGAALAEGDRAVVSGS